MSDAPDLTPVPRPELHLILPNMAPVKMSYGLLMDLQRLLPNPQAALELAMTDPYTQDYVVRRVMTPTNATITKMEDLIGAEQITLEPEQIENLLTWVVEHVLHFFVQRASKLAKAGENFKTHLPSLFTLGSEDSPLKTPSAGPSE